MKKIVLTICAIAISLMVFSNLFVTNRDGEVQIMRDGKWIDVDASMEVKGTDSLKTGQYGKVDIDDRANKASYTFQSIEPKSVKDLIASYKRPVSPNLLEQIYNFFKNLPTDPHQPGVSAKGEEFDLQVAMALKCKRSRASDYLVSFTLIDLNTEERVSQVYEGQLVGFQIDNHSETPIFVNIIDRDEKGVDTALFPTTYLQSFLDLYIPAYSSIRLMTRPYVMTFSPANTTDQLTLVAYPLPFNLPHVLEIMKETDCSQKLTSYKSIGIYHVSVPIVSAGSH